MMAIRPRAFRRGGVARTVDGHAGVRRTRLPAPLALPALQPEMRAARLLLFGVLGLACLSLLAAWQLPERLDWNRYRATIEALASASLGRPVTIAGKITLVLLPEPQLNAAEVVIGSWETVPGAEAPQPLRVASLRLRVAPLPLLLGRVDARELALRGPELVVAWPLAPGELAGWPPTWLDAFSARIEDGRLRVGNVQFTGINASFATSDSAAVMGALAGSEIGGTQNDGVAGDAGTNALRAAGTAELGGRKMRFAARLAGASPSRLDISLEGEGKLAGNRASFIGQVAEDGVLSGRVATGGRDLSQLLAAPALPFQVESLVKSAGGGLAFTELAAEIGGTPIRGSARLGPDPTGSPRLDLRLSAVRVELDPWLGLLSRVGAATLPVGLNLSAEAAELGGGTLRQLHAELEFSRTRIDVAQVAALLPGEAALRAAGAVQRGDAARPRFEGEASLDAPSLRTTLQWLDQAGLRLLPTLPAGVMERATIRAHVAAEPGLLALDRIDGRIGNGAVSGELRIWPGAKASSPRATGDASHAAIIASLDLEALHLDPWLPPDLSAGTLPRLLDPARLGGDFDVDLRLRARAATLAGEAIGPFLLDIATQGGVAGNIAETRLTLRRLEARLRGVAVVATGVLGQGGRIADGRIDATTPDASGLAELISPGWRPATAFWRGPATLSLQLAGPPEALAARLALDVSDARLEASPLFDLRAGRWSGPVTLRHPNAVRLLSALEPSGMGLPAVDGWVGDGSLSVIAQISGTPAVAPAAGSAFHIAAEALDITAGASRLSAPFSLELGKVPKLTARVSADSLALPGLRSSGNALLPLTLLRGWQADVAATAHHILVDLQPILGSSSATITLADGALRLAPFSTSLGGGILTGGATFDVAQMPPAMTLDATLRDANIAGPVSGLKLDLLAGRANATMRLSATGYSPSTLLATLQGDVALDVDDGVLTGFDLFRVQLLAGRADRRNRAATEAGLREALAGGPTAFERLELHGTASAGALTLHDTRLVGVAGKADFSGTIGLANSMVDLRVALHPAIMDPPEIALRLVGKLDDPRRTPELAGFLRWLVERAQ